MFQNGNALKAIVLSATAGVLLAQTGCKAVGDAFIPHHEASYLTKGCVTTIKFSRASVSNAVHKTVCAELIDSMQKKNTGKLADSVIGVAAGILVDQTAKAVEIESKKYATTYSARSSDYYCVDGSNVVGISFLRTDVASNVLFSFSMEVLVDPENQSIRFMPSNVVIKATAGKVYCSRFLTWPHCLCVWEWPGDLTWNVWRYVLRDETVSEVAFNVRVVIDAVVPDLHNEGGVLLSGTKAVNLCIQDFPLGKHDIEKIARKGDDHLITEEKLQTLTSGFMPFPDVVTTGNKRLPLNVTVTVTEGNDLGDIIGKGATELKENKDKITKRIIEEVGKL